MTSPNRLIAAALVPIALLAGGCASPPDEADQAVPHGYVEGATEAAEPQLHLVAVTAAGDVRLRDLLTDEESMVAGLDGVRALSTNGRYAFAASERGLTIIDSGVWTVDHEDHFHYYRADPRVVGTIKTDGVAEVVSGAVHTAVTAGGRSVLLDSAGLGEGRIEEVARWDADVVVPQAGALAVARNGTVEVLDVDGGVLAEGLECLEPAGTITTSVGGVIGCAGGAELATGRDGDIRLEWIPYPDGATERALEFRNRSGRPTVAAVAGTAGAWMLDTRERAWLMLPTEVPLLQVSAVDDSGEHVVALAVDGSILVLHGGTGATLARTPPLLAEPDAPGVELAVDSGRAYLNDPAAGVVYEIDYADGARIARELTVGGPPAFLVVTGQ